MLTQTKNFYGSMVPTEIDGMRFVRFASKIDGIMSQFLTTGQMLGFGVRVEKSESAYIDFESKKRASCCEEGEDWCKGSGAHIHAEIEPGIGYADYHY